MRACVCAHKDSLGDLFIHNPLSLSLHSLLIKQEYKQYFLNERSIPHLKVQFHWSKFNQIELIGWPVYPPPGSIFPTVTMLRFSCNDIFNISQHKNTKVPLITQQYDRLRPSLLIISPSILRNKVFCQFLIAEGYGRALCCGQTWRISLLFWVVCCRWASFHFK